MSAVFALIYAERVAAFVLLGGLSLGALVAAVIVSLLGGVQ